MRRSLTNSFAVALLAVPGFVLLAAHKPSEPNEVSDFVVNYLYMAAPQILVAVLAMLFTSIKTKLLVSLLLLDITLIIFRVWIQLAVPARESGLAWVLYFPVSAAVLLLFALAAAFKNRAPKSPTTSH